MKIVTVGRVFFAVVTVVAAITVMDVKRVSADVLGTMPCAGSMLVLEQFDETVRATLGGYTAEQVNDKITVTQGAAEVLVIDPADLVPYDPFEIMSGAVALSQICLMNRREMRELAMVSNLLNIIPYSVIRPQQNGHKNQLVTRPPNNTAKSIVHMYAGILAINVVKVLEVVNNFYYP